MGSEVFIDAEGIELNIVIKLFEELHQKLSDLILSHKIRTGRENLITFTPQSLETMDDLLVK